jgi:hypothetical protein
LRHCRALDRLRRHVSAALRLHKTRLDAQLRPFGLRLEGFEIRGWRTSPLRPRLMAIRRPTAHFPRTRQLRLNPSGSAASALRKKTRSISASPGERIETLLAARRKRGRGTEEIAAKNPTKAKRPSRQSPPSPFGATPCAPFDISSIIQGSELTASRSGD